MTNIDTICRRLRDTGIFLIGLAAIGLTAQYIYSQTLSPQARMKRTIEESFAQGMEKAFAEPSNQ